MRCSHTYPAACAIDQSPVQVINNCAMGGSLVAGILTGDAALIGKVGGGSRGLGQGGVIGRCRAVKQVQGSEAGSNAPGLASMNFRLDLPDTAFDSSLIRAHPLTTLLPQSLDSDAIVEPVRGPLIPGFAAVKEAAHAAGALGCWLCCLSDGAWLNLQPMCDVLPLSWQPADCSLTQP